MSVKYKQNIDGSRIFIIKNKGTVTIKEESIPLKGGGFIPCVEQEIVDVIGNAIFISKVVFDSVLQAKYLFDNYTQKYAEFVMSDTLEEI